MDYTVKFVAGYSPVDHGGDELRRIALDELEGRKPTKRNVEAAIARACKRAHQMARDNPASFGLFRGSLPRLDAVPED